jgi:hypothetical protein
VAFLAAAERRSIHVFALHGPLLIPSIQFGHPCRQFEVVRIWLLTKLGLQSCKLFRPFFKPTGLVQQVLLMRFLRLDIPPLPYPVDPRNAIPEQQGDDGRSSILLQKIPHGCDYMGVFAPSGGFPGDGHRLETSPTTQE